MPNYINGAYSKAEKEDQDKYTGKYSFSCGKSRGAEINRQKQKREYSAINEGKSLRTDSIVRARQELYEYVEKFKS